MAVVGTEGWAGKTSVILSSMLSHHRTNGLWDFFFFIIFLRSKNKGWQRYQLVCDLLLLFSNEYQPPCSTSSKDEDKKKKKRMEMATK